MPALLKLMCIIFEPSCIVHSSPFDELFIDIFLLAIWIFQFVFAVINIVNGTNINPQLFMCAVIVCIVYHIQEIFKR